MLHMVKSIILFLILCLLQLPTVAMEGTKDGPQVLYTGFPTQASRFFERKYPFSPLLLNRKAIDRALMTTEIIPELFLSAYQFDAFRSRVPESIEKLYGLFTKPFASFKFVLQNAQDPRLALLIELGIESQLPWAFFVKGEREKTDANPFSSWHYLAASRGYEPAKLYVAPSYTRRKYPLFLTKLPPTPTQLIRELYEEWNEKKYSVALSDLNGFLMRNGIGIYRNLEREIAKLRGDKDELFEIASTHLRSHNKETALIYFEHAARLGHFKATRCLWSMLNSLADGQYLPKILEFARRGAELGDVFSMCRMGDFYLTGFHGQEPDGNQALLYYKEGAARRDATAISKLATLLADGSGGVVPNPGEGLRLFLEAADLGYVPAMYDAGCLLMNGAVGIEQDHPAALKQFNRAAVHNHVHAIFNAGCLMRDSYKDKRAALMLFDRAASLGDRGGIYSAGCIHMEGYDSQEPDYGKALKCFVAAAKAGHMKAMVNGATVARMHFEGHEPDVKLSLELLLQAVAHGDVGSMFNAGCIYHTDLKGPERDDVQALKYYLMAGEHGDAEAYTNAANIYLVGVNGQAPNEEEALQCFIKAAKLGNVPAALEVARQLQAGVKGRVPNEKEAFKYVLMAAANGDVHSLFNAGFALVKGGYGQAIDKRKALGLFKQAAAKGDVDSMMNVAIIYSTGCEGQEPDENMALEYWKKAAAMGNVEGIYQAGLNLMRGFNRRKPDLKTALQYMEQAAEKGHLQAAFDAGLLIYQGILTDDDLGEQAIKRKLNDPNNKLPLQKSQNYIKTAADNGLVKAMLFYGMIMFGTFEEDDQALEYFKRAAAKAEVGSEVYIEANYHVGDLLLGAHKVKADLKESLRHIRIAASYGHLEATYNAGCLLKDGFEGHKPDLKEAFRHFQNAAQAGHVKAICNKGCMLSKGFEGQEPDEAAALECYKRSAALGDSLSMHHAGVSLLSFCEERSALRYFEDGAAHKDVRSMERAGCLWIKGFKGQAPDLTKALSFFKKSAALGDVTSAYNAGVTLLNFKDRRSIQQAISYFLTAAHKGYAPAMLALCKMYLFEFDELAKAEHWFEMAKQSDPSCTLELEDLASRKLQEGIEDSDQEKPLEDFTSKEVETLTDHVTITPGALEPSKLLPSKIIRTIYAMLGKREQKGDLPALKEDEEKSIIPDIEFEEPSSNYPVVTKKRVQLVKLAKGLADHFERDRHEHPLEVSSIQILKGIKIKDQSIGLKHLEELFKDPFFKGQVQISNTKSGFYISAINRATKRNGTCGTHRKHGQSFDGFDWNFLGDLWKMLDHVYEIGTGMGDIPKK
jgi:TPR repeat protein